MAAEPRKKLAITIREAADLLSYEPKKIRELIRTVPLATISRGRGTRIILSSLHQYLEQLQCQTNANQPNAERRAKAVRGSTRKRAGTSGASRTKGNGTRLQTATKNGQKLDL